MTIVDRRSVETVGRHARLELAFECRKGRTVLAKCYAEPPFRAAHVFEEGAALHMIMASSAPGVFGGDRFEQIIEVGPGASVRLTSQSALQLHPSLNGAVAELRSLYRVAEGAELQCVWDPIIPFEGAHLDQRIEIQLSADGRLVWSDALMSGREARGEEWQFASMAHELRVARGETLEYLERYRIAPCRQNVRHAWIADDAAYFGTVLASGWPVNEEDLTCLNRQLAAIDGVSGAVDALDSRLALVRLASTSGAAFRKARSVAESQKAVRSLFADQNR